MTPESAIQRLDSSLTNVEAFRLEFKSQYNPNLTILKQSLRIIKSEVNFFILLEPKPRSPSTRF